MWRLFHEIPAVGAAGKGKGLEVVSKPPLRPNLFLALGGGPDIEGFGTTYNVSKALDDGAGGEMNFNDAQLFVLKMREDNGFRSSITRFDSAAEFWDFLKRNGFEFDACDLVKAMAACMASSDQMP